MSPAVSNVADIFRPPPGVTPNFSNPYTRGPIFTIVGSILITIMIIFVVVRIYTKTYILRKVYWDDLTCVLATLGTIAYFVSALLCVKAKLGTHQWNMKLLDITSNHFLIPTYLVAVIASPTLLFTKITFFLMYLQLFKRIKLLRFCIYAGMIFTSGFYVSSTVVQLYYETPRRDETFLSHRLGPLGEKSKIMSVPTAAVGIAIDFYILILPIVVVLRLQLAKKQKIGLCLVFGTGSMACLASVLSVLYRIQLNESTDYMWTGIPVVILMLVEICVGVICSCMPAFSYILRHHLHSFQILKSRFSSCYRSFRNLFSGHNRHKSIYTNSRPGDGCLKPYSSLESSRKSKTQPKYLPTLRSQLGQLNTLRTYVRVGHKNESSEEGIHVTRDIEQGWQRKSTGTGEVNEDCVSHENVTQH